MTQCPLQPTSAPIIPVLKNVSKAFGDHSVISDVSLSLAQGGITCLLGPSGCGKSTLLRVATSLLLADAGSVLIQPHETAMVFQEPRLLPWLTVEENLALAVQGPRREKKSHIRKVLDLVELGSIEQLLPRELSGGMAQRVGLARALLRRPRYLFMDEPFAALDAITRSALQKMLVTLIAEQQITCLFVTHDIHEALLIGTHIHVMREGKLVLDCASNPGLASSCCAAEHPKTEQQHAENDAAHCQRLAIKERILACLQKP